MRGDAGALAAAAAPPPSCSSPRCPLCGEWRAGNAAATAAVAFPMATEAGALFGRMLSNAAIGPEGAAFTDDGLGDAGCDAPTAAGSASPPSEPGAFGRGDAGGMSEPFPVVGDATSLLVVATAVELSGGGSCFLVRGDATPLSARFSFAPERLLRAPGDATVAAGLRTLRLVDARAGRDERDCARLVILRLTAALLSFQLGDSADMPTPLVTDQAQAHETAADA